MDDKNKLLRLCDLTGITLQKAAIEANISRRTVFNLKQGSPVKKETVEALTAAVVRLTNQERSRHECLRDVVLAQLGIDLDVYSCG